MLPTTPLPTTDYPTTHYPTTPLPTTPLPTPNAQHEAPLHSEIEQLKAEIELQRAADLVAASRKRSVLTPTPTLTLTPIPTPTLTLVLTLTPTPTLTLTLTLTLSFHQALVFCNHHSAAAGLARALCDAGFPAAFVSGEHAQEG